MKLKKRTIYALLLGLFLIVVSGFLGFFIGSQNAEMVVVKDEQVVPTKIMQRPMKGCTKDLRVCPDGTRVVRSGPQCTFAPCPSGIPSKAQSGACATGGCSGEICADAAKVGNIVSACVYQEEYACLRLTKCERQSNGNCGWTETEAYNRCLQDN